MEVKDLYKQAKELGVCSMMTGNETVEELFQLLSTPQGLEFYQKTGFPAIDILRQFKGFQSENAGIYIDAGEITLHGKERVILAGNTVATLTYDDMATQRNNVAVMHGASANIVASNWAVVFTSNLGGIINKEAHDNARIL